MKKSAFFRNAMLLAAACCSFSQAAGAGTAQSPLPAKETVTSDGSSQLAGTGVFGVILAILFGSAVIYGLYDVLFDEDNEDQPASP